MVPTQRTFKRAPSTCYNCTLNALQMRTPDVPSNLQPQCLDAPSNVHPPHAFKCALSTPRLTTHAPSNAPSTTSNNALSNAHSRRALKRALSMPRCALKRALSTPRHTPTRLQTHTLNNASTCPQTRTFKRALDNLEHAHPRRPACHPARPKDK